MQQPVTRRDVYEPSLLAMIGGRVVEVSSASMDRSLPDPLAGGRLRSASASFTAVEGPDVVSAVATPWDPGTVWPPVPQQPASVSMDTGAGPVSLLGGGQVVSASGGTSGREVEVEVADRYESLNKTISWDAFAAATPSLDEAQTSRYVGLHTTAITDRILRHCGWYSTPPNMQWIRLSVPAQGTMWPEIGTVTDSVRRSDQNGYPSWVNSPWGVAISDVEARYILGGSAYSIRDRGRIELAAMTLDGGSMLLSARDDTDRELVRLSWSNTVAYLSLRSAAGSMVAVAQVPRVNGLLYGTVEYVSDTAALVTLRAGGVSVGEFVTTTADVTTTPLRRASISGDGKGGGFQIAQPSQSGTLTGWSPSAVLYPRGGNRNNLMVLPSVQGENCADLLARQCEVECATYWIDETGVLRWWDLARLDSRNSVATLTSDDDIAEAGFAWRHDLSQLKSRVPVKWRQPLREWSWRTRVDLWQGRGKTIQPGDAPVNDPVEDWINVPDDEIWLMPDLSISRVGDSYGDFNYGVGSWYGGVTDRGDGQDTWAQLHGSLITTIERVTDRAFKMSTFWTGAGAVTLKTLDADAAAGTQLWRRRRGMDLPVIRGKAKYMLTDRLTYSAQSGPKSAPEHEIDAGWWIQDEAQAQYTADYAGARLTIPQPVLSSVALIPVPGLQLGDVVEVRDDHVTRLTVRGIVIEDSRTINADMDMTHSVAIRPTYITRNGVTFEEWGSAVRNSTYTQWGTRQAGDTYQQWGANPLLREDVI